MSVHSSPNIAIERHTAPTWAIMVSFENGSHVHEESREKILNLLFVRQGCLQSILE